MIKRFKYKYYASPTYNGLETLYDVDSHYVLALKDKTSNWITDSKFDKILQFAVEMRKYNTDDYDIIEYNTIEEAWENIFLEEI